MLRIKDSRNCFVCKTKEIALRFFEECKKQGVTKWANGMNIDELEEFYPYGENTYYVADYYNGIYGSRWELHYGDISRENTQNPFLNYFDYNGETDVEWVLSEIKQKKKELKVLYK